MMIIIVIGVVYESLTFHIYRFNISSNLHVKIIFFDRGEAAEGFLLLYFDFGNIRKLPKWRNLVVVKILKVSADTKRREPPLHGAAAQCQCC